jgi:hypothetical protein
LDEIERLHTAARRFCMTPPSGEPRESGVRMDLLDAILIEVERSVPGDFTSVEEARTLLDVAGQTTPLLTAAVRWGRREPWAAAVIADARERFCTFVAQFESATAELEPLPYRRVLSQAEVLRLTEALKQTWGTGPGDWYPRPDDPRDDVGEFDAYGFYAVVTDDEVRGLLRRHGVSWIYEFPEGGPPYKIGLESLEPSHDGDDHFWCDDSFSWVLFASHEHSVAVGGRWLLDGLRQLWPDWRLPSWRRRVHERGLGPDMG